MKPYSVAELLTRARAMERPGRACSRVQLLGRVWEDEGDIDFRTVDVHIGRLRKALKQEGKPNLIRTVRTAGYSLDIEN